MSNHRGPISTPSSSIHSQHKNSVGWPSPAQEKELHTPVQEGPDDDGAESEVTAKSARNFWQQKMSQPRNTTNWKKSTDGSSTKGNGNGNVSAENGDRRYGSGGNSYTKSPSSPTRSYVSGSSLSDFSQSSKTFQAMAQKSASRAYSSAQKPPALVENEDETDYGESSAGEQRSHHTPQHDHNPRREVQQKGTGSGARSFANRLSQWNTPTSAQSRNGSKDSSQGVPRSIGRRSNSYSIQQEETHAEQHSKYYEKELSFHSNPDSPETSNSMAPTKPDHTYTNHHHEHNSPPQSQPRGQMQSQHQNNTSEPKTEDGTLGEMQIKLDIALAKVLTEEMKYADVQSQLKDLQTSSQSQISSLQSKIKSMQQREEEWKEDREVQREEVKELYMEIERLHESHRAERGLVEGRKGEMDKVFGDLRREIDELKRERANMQEEMKEMSRSVNSSNGDEVERMKADIERKDEMLKHTKEELNGVRNDVDAITKDFKELADETERLEIELEAVTEDRDELLRRSIVYQNHSPGKIKDRKKQSSSLSQSSQVDYDEKQLQDEIGRLKAALDEEQIQGKMKDAKIQDLESTVQHSKSLLDLDVSAIDLENTSYLVERDEARKELEEKSKRMQEEYDAVRNELEAVQRELAEANEERNQLKDCLADAIEELDQCEKQKVGENDAFAQELMQIVKEKDAEIEVLTDQLAAEIDRRKVNTTGEESFHEELNNVVQWLDSSTRINGSPSIEMMMLRDTTDNVTLAPQDDAVVQALYHRIRDIYFKMLDTEANLEAAKRNETYDDSDNAYETSTEASFEREAIMDTSDPHRKRDMDLKSKRETNDILQKLRTHLKNTRDELLLREKTNKELRDSLSEAANLIKPLKEHVTRIETERTNLQSELAISSKRIMRFESSVGKNEDVSSTRILQLERQLEAALSRKQNGKFVEVAASDLQKKNEEIFELKLAVNQLRRDLAEAPAEVPVQDEMPTPTKSNRGKDRSRFTGSAQATNEEDDMKSRMIASKVDGLERELKKRISTEETLKSILQESSVRLTKLSAQATNLAEQKNEAESRIEQLENEKLQLQQQLESSKNNDEFVNDAESKAEVKKLQEKNDKMSIQIADVKSQLKAKSREMKKLKKSLNEAVGMLNSLRNVVQNSEKQRKKLKRHLRNLNARNDASLKSDKTSVTPESSQAHLQADEFIHEPDPDQMENQTTILNLRSHIVEMEHEIKTLEERLDEVEVSNPPGESIDIDYGDQSESVKVIKLRQELAEAKSAYEVTKTMLGEVSEINKEMLNDLKQTEDEAAEALEELNSLQRRYETAMDEIEDAKYVATFTMKKIDGEGNEDQRVYNDLQKLPLADCINRLERRISALVDSSRLDWSAD